MLCREELASLPGYGIELVSKRGRFAEEENIEVYSVQGGVSQRLFVIKVFHGRPPYYRRWIEVFMIRKHVYRDGVLVGFAGSDIEEKLVECLSRVLREGEWLYVEYTYDEETKQALEIGIPPVLTRLGYLLFKYGFTWFKDWYYPEGFMEGSPKLQAEKPLSEDIAKKHREMLCSSVETFRVRLDRLYDTSKYSWIAARAIERAEEILEECTKQS